MRLKAMMMMAVLVVVTVVDVSAVCLSHGRVLCKQWETNGAKKPIRRVDSRRNAEQSTD
jgi:hypothetical protein